MHGPQTEPLLHGVMAEFRTPEELLEAIGAAKAAGFTKLDAYTPYPIERVLDALDLQADGGQARGEFLPRCGDGPMSR